MKYNIHMAKLINLRRQQAAAKQAASKLAHSKDGAPSPETRTRVPPECSENLPVQLEPELKVASLEGRADDPERAAGAGRSRVGRRRYRQAAVPRQPEVGVIGEIEGLEPELQTCRLSDPEV